MVPKEAFPPLHSLLNTSPRITEFLLAADLPLRRRQLLLDIVNRHEHLLHAAQVRRQILSKAARHKCARGVPPGEEIVAPAGAVDDWIGRDVEDGPVDGEVDGQGAVGAVVEGEFAGC